MRVISRLAEGLLAFEELLCTMELVTGRGVSYCDYISSVLYEEMSKLEFCWNDSESGQPKHTQEKLICARLEVILP
jgi:hypothetical protein